MKTVLFLSDTQYPAIHYPAWLAAIEVASAPIIDEIWFLGDGIDFPMLTHKFPIDPAERLEIQNHLDSWNTRLGLLHLSSSAQKYVYLLGNHEHRLQSYLWFQATELSGLRGLQLTSLLPALNDWEVHPWHELVPVSPTFVATHGEVVSKYAGATAKQMLDRTAISGIMGHTHRLGASVRRVVKVGGGYRYLGWWENGCLADDNKMNWTRKGTEDWQLGFSVGTFDGDDFALEQIFVHEDGHFYWRGERYG